jgi:hypothetical protein
VGTPIIKEINMNKDKHDYAYKITMSAETVDFGDKTTVESYATDLNDMSDVVLSFLNAMGFSYVYDVSFHKESGDMFDD